MSDSREQLQRDAAPSAAKTQTRKAPTVCLHLHDIRVRRWNCVDRLPNRSSPVVFISAGRRTPVSAMAGLVARSMLFVVCRVSCVVRRASRIATCDLRCSSAAVELLSTEAWFDACGDVVV